MEFGDAQWELFVTASLATVSEFERIEVVNLGNGMGSLKWIAKMIEGSIEILRDVRFSAPVWVWCDSRS